VLGLGVEGLDELDEEHMESVFYPDLFIFSHATSSWYSYAFSPG